MGLYFLWVVVVRCNVYFVHRIENQSSYLEDEVIEWFTSDFKAIAKFFKGKRLKKDAVADNRVEFEIFNGSDRLFGCVYE